LLRYQCSAYRWAGAVVCIAEKEIQRTIAVTGAASGIGAATARLLRQSGHRVIGVDLGDTDIVADLGRPDGRALAIRHIHVQCGGRLHGLVTCAGVSPAVQDEARVLAINFFGTAALLAGLRTDLATAVSAAAVAVASWAMLLGSRRQELIDACLGMDEQHALTLAAASTPAGDAGPAYASSKCAVALLVRRWAPSTDWAGAGITLNAVVPSVTRTPMIARHLASAEATRALLATAPSPMATIAEPEDVAELIVFLVSGRARLVTGQLIFVDGGLDALRRPHETLQALPR
jgi:NAD(P)-dependent dehydrogenase (short-subunit alcohol dehydrogenase family)